MPFTAEQKRNVIINAGYNPDEYDLDEASSSLVKKSAPTAIRPDDTKHEESLMPPLAKSGNQYSRTETVLRHAGTSAFPTAAGLAAMVGVPTLAGSVVPGLGNLGGFALGLGSAIGATYGAKKIQEPFISEEYKRKLAESAEQHPNYALAGELAPSMVAFNPIKGIAELPTLARGVSKLPALARVGRSALTDVEANALKNAAVSGGIATGQEGYSQLTDDQPGINLSEAAKHILPALILNEPTKIGKKVLGFHSTGDIRQAEALRNAERQQADKAYYDYAQVEQIQKELTPPVVTGSKTLRDLTTNYRSTNKGIYPDVDAMSRYKRTPEEPDIATFEGEGGATPKYKPEEGSYDQAVAEKYTQNLAEQRKVKAELDRQEAAQLASENAARALELKQGFEENIARREEKRPEVKQKLGFTERVKPVEEELPAKDYTGVMEENIRENTETPLTEAERIQELYDRGEQFSKKPVDREEPNKWWLNNSGELHEVKMHHDDAERIARENGVKLQVGDPFAPYKGLFNKGFHRVVKDSHGIYVDNQAGIPINFKQLKALKDLSIESNLPVVDDKGKVLFYPDQYSKETSSPSSPTETQDKAIIARQKQLAINRGFKPKEIESIQTPEGEEVAGVNPNNPVREGFRSKSHGGVGTFTHEFAGHGLVNDLETSQAPRDNKLFEKGVEIFKKDSDPKESLAIAIERMGIDRDVKHLYGTKREKFKQWWEDTKSHFKVKAGVESDEDVVRHILARYESDAPFGSRAEITGERLGNKGQYNKANIPSINFEDGEYITKGPDGTEIGRGKTLADAKRHLKDNGFDETNYKYGEHNEGEQYSRISVPVIRSEIQKLRAQNTPEAEKIADGATGFYERFVRFKGKYINDIVRPVREMLGIGKDFKSYLTQNNESANKILQYAYDIKDKGSSSITLTPKEETVLETARDYFHDTRVDQNTRELLREGGFDRNYIPEIPDRKVLDIILNKGNSPEAKQYIQDFVDYQLAHGNTDPDAALKEFRAGYDKQNVNIANQYGPIDKAHSIGLPPSWREKNLLEVLSRYGQRVARRFAYHDAIENVPEIQDALKNPRTGNQSDTVRTILDDIYGIHPKAEIVRDVVGSIVKANMLGPLTGAKDLVTSATLGWQHQTPSQAVKLSLKRYEDFKQNWEESHSQGVNRESIASIENMLDDTIPVLRRVATISSDVSGRNILEKTARTLGYSEGKFLAMDNFNEFQRSGALHKQGTDFLDKFGPKDWRKLESLSEEQIRESAAKYVESVQGTYDYRGLPAWSTQGSLHPIFSLAKWNIEKFNNYVEHVVNPAKEGNYTPLLMSTLGLIIGGTATEKLVELVQNRKQKQPSLGELAKAKEDDAEGYWKGVAYKAAAITSLSGYTGILGDVAKMTADLSFKNKPQTYHNVLIDFAANIGDSTADLIEALNNGDIDVGLDYMLQIIQDNNQAIRVVLNHPEIYSGINPAASDAKKQELEKQDKFRDYKTFKNLYGYPVGDMNQTRPNKLMNKDVREYKQTDDLSRAIELYPDLISKAFEKADGDVEKFMKILRGYKGNSYQTMPKPENNPLEFMKYRDYIDSTQDKAGELMQDYYRQNAINKAKSAMVP